VWAYRTHKLPVSPLTYPIILGHDSEALDEMSDRFIDLPNWRPQMAERAQGLKADLAASEIHAEIEERVAHFNRDWRELDRLIAAQNWRVAFFRVAEDEINYRRFFNINDLAGLRTELGPVFAHAHRRVLKTLADGEIDGLRIDHLDGLLDPKAYLLALRESAQAPFYLIVEKILAPHERLRRDWPIEGTTGYDYANLSLALLVDPSAEPAFTEAYRAFTGVDDDFARIAVAAKLRIMDNEMASELNALSRAAAALARQSPMTSDLTEAILKRAIRAIVANFPVYRTYVDFAGAPSEADRRDVAWAMKRAHLMDTDIHPSAFDFIARVLLGASKQSPAKEISRTAALRLAMKLQQYSGPVMAKGVEDTAFYRFNRFIALNEVGGAPERFGAPPSLIHKANAERAERWPRAILATATHDTKRGEDARARLAVLSELPEEWRRQVATWSRLIRARLGDVEGGAPPDRNDEYMLYQMLIGSWPIELLDSPASAALDEFRKRIAQAVEKSLREGKKRSTWAAPNLEYERAMLAFVGEALRPEGGFLQSFLPFVQRVARLGAENSLVQTALKLTAPGVPDIYQGCEFWDLSLVDPDNRRPVDYAQREQAIAELARELEGADGRAELFGRLMRDWRSGRVKLATTVLLLAFRRARPEPLAEGDYRPIAFKGEDTNLAFGFVRTLGEERVAVIVARFPALREAKPDWRAEAELPEGEWFDLVRGRRFEAGLPLREWLGGLPFAVLTSG
jgi:(1->4)-alpha-D-glucan 1-alpha-D-glucosylmutase